MERKQVVEANRPDIAQEQMRNHRRTGERCDRRILAVLLEPFIGGSREAGRHVHLRGRTFLCGVQHKLSLALTNKHSRDSSSLAVSLVTPQSSGVMLVTVKAVI